MSTRSNKSACRISGLFLLGLILSSHPSISLAGESLPAGSAPGQSLPGENPPGTARAENTYRQEIGLSAIWDDISHVITFPSRMDLTGGLILTGVLGTTGILMSQDENLRDWIRDTPGNDGTDLAARAGKWLGDGRLIVPLFLVSGVGGYLGKSRRLLRISVETLEALALSGLSAQILKITTGRSRPFRESGSWDFTGPVFSNEAFHSFPSGHAVTIGSVAGVMAGEFESIWIRLAAGGLVGLTAFQRMYADKHWASDVFLGSAIGIAAGYSIARHRKEKTAPRILIAPAALPPFHHSGIQITFIF